ncbi:MAG: Dam family site-specific DNA-(adenine-N6)-methyltransferase [Dehalococcoidia bacterium]
MGGSRPFLKWAGGKGRLAPLIAERAPVAFGRYFEPFLGGGAVFFALARGGAVRSGATLSDLNAELMQTYAAVRDRRLLLGRELERLAEGYDRQGQAGRAAFYYTHRKATPAGRVERAARLIFLNRTCYNGLYRVNRAGDFNVPHGRYVRPRLHDAENLAACSAALRGVELRTEDFERTCARARPGDFIYLDPPYQPLSATSRFTSYTSASFGPVEHERLAAAFEQLSARGVAALLSNSDHPAIRALYGGRGYTLEQVSMPRAINSNGAGRTPIPELLIANGQRPEVKAALLHFAEAEGQRDAFEGEGQAAGG